MGVIQILQRIKTEFWQFEFDCKEFENRESNQRYWWSSIITGDK